LKKKILITGGAGFIGSHLAEFLLKKKFNVYIFDNLSTGLKKNLPKKAIFIKGDCANKNHLKKLRKIDFSCIYHLAGQSSGEYSFYNPLIDFNSNLFGTINIIDLCLSTTNKRIIFSSSMSVYGDAKTKVSEKQIPSPKSFYGLSKLSAEKYLIFFKKKGLNFTTLRLFNVYGPGQNFENKMQGMVSIFLDQALSKKKIIVKGSKNRFRDFIYISDVVEILNNVRSNKKCFYETYNVGIGKKYRVFDLINIISSSLQIKKNNISYIAGTPDDTFGISCNNNKIKKVLNKSSFVDLVEGVKKTISNYMI
jgi:UDP-glucose 4-epimerase